MERRDQSQVVTYQWTAGGTLTSPRWLGSIGHVSGLSYGSVLPGGCDQMACLLAVPPEYRTDALNPGRVVRIFRGGSCVWDGKLDEPAPSAAGWSIVAHGNGNFGTDYLAVYGTGSPPADVVASPASAPPVTGDPNWNQNAPVNQAITRGLRWANPGIASTGMYLAQQSDSGSQTITDFLNLICTYGQYTWFVDRYGYLSVYPLPNTAPLAAANRLLVCTTPLARTIAADVNTIFTKYMATSDSAASSSTTTAAATYGVVETTVAASVAAHQPMESYLDLSSSQVLSSGAASAVAGSVLALFQRANFAGPFTVQPGQLMTMGGQPVDLGSEQAGTIVRLLVTDYGYGGEVIAGPIQFITGAYSYDDDTQTATLTPFQTVAESLSNLMSAMFPGGVLPP